MLTTVRKVLTVLLLSGAAALAADASSVRFDIPPQSLESALLSFSAQAGVQLVVANETIKGMKTPGIQGEYSANNALELLLKGSGLTYRVTDEKTIAIGNPDKAKRVSGTASQSAAGPLLLSQVDWPGNTANTSSTSPEPDAPSDDGLKPVMEVVVTGTHIRGAESTGSNLVVLDRQYIEKSGYSTVQDLLSTVPQVAPSSGADYNTVTGNWLGGTGIDLRGLGTGTTLVLVNGRRQAASGTYGNFVDISSIPLAAVERVEILLDGASANYGSDAVGGVVNFVLRKNFQGAETRARFGSYGGDANELQASQLLGSAWGSGSGFIGYQFQHRQELAATERSYSANSDQRSRGGGNFSSLFSNPGNIVNPLTGESVAIPTGQDGTALTPGSFTPGSANYRNVAQDYTLLPEERTHSGFFNLSQNLGQRVQLFADGRYTQRPLEGRPTGFVANLVVPSTNAFFVNPFSTPLDSVTVAYSFEDDIPGGYHGKQVTYDAGAGGRVQIGRSWQAELASGYSREKLSYFSESLDADALGAALADSNPATALNPFGDGSHTNPATLAAIRTTSMEAATSYRWNSGITADGPLFSLPGGEAKLALGTDYRKEVIPETGRGTARAEDLSRIIRSAFAELSIPVFGAGNKRAGFDQLTFSAAARYEDYSDFGSTVNPKLGFKYKPSKSVAFRGTWGTSFRAPNLTELEAKVFNPNVYILQFGYVDPASSSGTSNVVALFGVNPDLHEEKARTWTAGIDFAPEYIQDFTASLTYTDVRYKDRIGAPVVGGGANTVLAQEDVWYPIIQRNPSAAQLDEVCNSPNFVLPPFLCALLTPSAIIDFRVRNVAYTQVRSVDLRLDRRLTLSRGALTLGFDGTYSIDNEQAVTENAPVVDMLDKFNGPLSLRLRGRAGWQQGPVDAQLVVNYAPSYDQPFGNTDGTTRAIGSWTTVNLTAGYRFDETSGFTEGLEARLAVVNLFDKDPPYANNLFGYDGINADPYGRLMSIQLRKSW